MKNKLVFGFVIFFFVFISFGFQADRTLDTYSKKQIAIHKVDWIMVLAGGKELEPHIKDRLDNALTAAQLWPNAYILLTGNGRLGEVALMKKYLIENGISPNRIIEESMSTSTWTNFANSKKFVNDRDFVMVITNEFHQRRSLATANLMGYQAALFGKDNQKFPKELLYTVREYFSGIKWYFQYGLYKLSL